MIKIDLYKEILDDYIKQYEKSFFLIGKNDFSYKKIKCISEANDINIDIFKYVYSIIHKKNKKMYSVFNTNLCLNTSFLGNNILYHKGFGGRRRRYEKNHDLYFSDKDRKIYSISQNLYRSLLFGNKNILICPYCGKIGFIKRDNSIKKQSYSFELDHFFPKAEYPQFALSAYNLIPVCKICNQFIKGQRKFGIGNHFHPYLGVFHYDGNKFELINKKGFNDVFEFGLDIKNTTDVKGNIIDSKGNILDFESLGFWNTKAGESKEDYQSHLDYLLLDNIYKYSPDTKSDYSMFLNIKDVLLSGGKQTYEIKELFKNWYPKESKDILKFTNGKMKRDLIDRLEKLTPFLPIYLSALNKEK